MEKLKLLSLFSGIGAFEKALDRLGVDYELEGYSEIDKYASQAYALIHDTEEWMNLGDITKIDETKLAKDVDILTYGFPCQDISLAGNQKGLVDEEGNKTRSGLVWDATRIIKATKPKVAIAENVKNLVSKKFKKEFEAILAELEEAGYNNYWKVLNAKEHGIAQNRERVFIVSIRKDIDLGLFEFPEPEELKTRLLDYLEDEVDEKYFLSDKMMAYLTDMKDRNGFVRGKRFNPHTLDSEYAFAITTNAGQRPTDNFIIMPEKTKKGYTLAEEGDGVYINRPHQKRGVVQKGVIQTIKTSGNDLGVVVKDSRNLKEKLCDDLIESGIVKGGEVINHSYTSSDSRPNLEDFIETKSGIMPTLTTRPDTLGVVVKGGAIRNRPNENGMNRPNLELRKDDVSNALTTFDKDNVVVVGEYRRDVGIRTFKDGVIGTLRTKEAGGDKVVVTNSPLRIRKLTPKECWRLMGFDDEDHDKVEAAGISNSQRYKMAGNSIVVNVVAKILKNLIETVL